MMQKHKPSTEQIREWLDAVPDPEIPVISLVDLGVIRDIEWQGDRLRVTVTPTYSGCPATGIINLDIETALRDRGIRNIEIVKTLSPAWTTDWISEKGREKMLAYGVVPPQTGTACTSNSPAPEVKCPRCNSENTKLVSQFGSTPCKSSYCCKECLEPFDYFKCI